MKIFNLGPDRPDRIINELYAYISEDPKTGLEGLCSFFFPNGDNIPAISSSPKIMEMGKEFMLAQMQGTGIKIKRVTFKKVSEEDLK